MAGSNIQLSGGAATHVAFTSQGQVDWVAFGNTVFSASLRVMQRLASAGIQPTTHCGGLALASQFQLGQLGTRRMERALANLPTSPLFDSIIYIGFGMQSFVKSLTETQTGFNLAALCGCLTAAHSEPLAARILAALWDKLGFPVDYKPSHSQFRQLVKNCAGICHTTTFSSTVDVMLGGSASRRRTGSEHDIIPFHASAAEEIAAAMKGLFDVSMDNTEQIVVVGGSSASFIAALSYWLFNLRTMVLESDESLIFTSHDGQESTQVLIRYLDVDYLDNMQVASKSYVLRPNEGLTQTDDAELRMMRLIIRTPWNDCLERAYGSIANDCLRHTRQLGAYLGSVARVYDALANAESAAGGFSRKAFNAFALDSHGLGLIQSSDRILPELSKALKLKEIMMSAFKGSVKDSLSTAEVSLFDLKKACTCGPCNGQDSNNYSRRQDCLPSMAMTIRKLLNVLSAVVNDHRIEPSVSGLEEIFLMQQLEWNEALHAFENHRQDDMTAIILGLKNDNGEGVAAYEYATAAMLTKDVETIFLGDRLSDNETERAHDRTAFSKFGTCIYLQALHDVTCSPAVIGQIHIIPGHISYMNRRYEEILDSAAKGTASKFFIDIDAPLQAVSFDMTSSSNIRGGTWEAEPVKMDAIVTEVIDADTLRFVYRATVASGAVYINPALFTARVLESAGIVPCKLSHRNQDTLKISELALQCAVIKNGWYLSQQALEKLPHHFGLACCIWASVNDEYARCAAFAYQHQQEYVIPDQNFGLENRFEKYWWHVRVLLRQHQCIQCCTADLVDTMGGFGNSLQPEDRVLVHFI